jgi:hypothetical protein
VRPSSLRRSGATKVRSYRCAPQGCGHAPRRVVCGFREMRSGAGLGRGAAVRTRTANPPDHQDVLLAELGELLCLSTEAQSLWDRARRSDPSGTSQLITASSARSSPPPAKFARALSEQIRRNASIFSCDIAHAVSPVAGRYHQRSRTLALDSHPTDRRSTAARALATSGEAPVRSAKASARSPVSSRPMLGSAAINRPSHRLAARSDRASRLWSITGRARPRYAVDQAPARQSRLGRGYGARSPARSERRDTGRHRTHVRTGRRRAQIRREISQTTAANGNTTSRKRQIVTAVSSSRSRMASKSTWSLKELDKSCGQCSNRCGMVEAVRQRTESRDDRSLDSDRPRAST